MTLMALLLSACVAPVCDADAEVELREKIVYSKVGDRELLLDAYLPKTAGPRPAVLVVHGGAWRSGNRRQLRFYAQSLAKKGLACFAIDYRLAPQHKFPAQIEDCRAAVKWIRTHAAQYAVNPKKLGAIGYSAGGHLVSLLGTTGQPPNKENGHVDTRLQAVAAGGAPGDFRKFSDNGRWAEYLMGGDLDSAPGQFLNASPAAFVDRNDPPVFFFNGKNDRLVPLTWTRPLHKELQKAGVRTELHTIEGADHMQAARNPQALRKACDFLHRELTAPEPAR